MNDAASALTAINCVTCGASQNLLGGHKVKSVTCGHCGAVMDRHNGCILLQQYRGMPRPDGPLSIGMSGVLNGVKQTVIGIVGLATDVERRNISLDRLSIVLADPRV